MDYMIGVVFGVIIMALCKILLNSMEAYNDIIKFTVVFINTVVFFIVGYVAAQWMSGDDYE